MIAENNNTIVLGSSYFQVFSAGEPAVRHATHTAGDDADNGKIRHLVTIYPVLTFWFNSSPCHHLNSIINL